MISHSCSNFAARGRTVADPPHVIGGQLLQPTHDRDAVERLRSRTFEKQIEGALTRRGRLLMSFLGYQSW
jgi:hypothetical protein